MAKGKRRDTEMVRIGPEAKRLLKVEAARRDQTMSELLAECVRAYLKKPSSVSA